MSLSKLKALPLRERREALAQFLLALDRDPELEHFRTLVAAGPERQLALFAALEREAFRGSAAQSPPAVDDVADQLLCDVLEAIDRDRNLSNRGAYYGCDRHQANLRALGAWSGQPRALELFATAYSGLNPSGGETLPACAAICSPAPQVSQSNGELIAASIAEKPEDSAGGGGLIRHAGAGPGEQSLTALPASSGSLTATDGSDLTCPPRQVRRGRPPVLDDQAKGRLLGLMSYGLSFRQAAAQLGVHHQTLLNALKRDAEFAQQVAEARLDAISQPLVVVIEAARRNWRAAAWLAKFLDGRRVGSYEQTPEERELAKPRA
jgi:hypothetical protein